MNSVVATLAAIALVASPVAADVLYGEVFDTIRGSLFRGVYPLNSTDGSFEPYTELRMGNSYASQISYSAYASSSAMVQIAPSNPGGAIMRVSTFDHPTVKEAAIHRKDASLPVPEVDHDGCTCLGFDSSSSTAPVWTYSQTIKSFILVDPITGEVTRETPLIHDESESPLPTRCAWQPDNHWFTFTLRKDSTTPASFALVSYSVLTGKETQRIELGSALNSTVDRRSLDWSFDKKSYLYVSPRCTFQGECNVLMVNPSAGDQQVMQTRPISSDALQLNGWSALDQSTMRLTMALGPLKKSTAADASLYMAYTYDYRRQSLDVTGTLPTGSYPMGHCAFGPSPN